MPNIRRLSALLTLLWLTACSVPSPTARAAAAAGQSWTEFRMNGPNNPAIRGNLRAAWRVATDGSFSSSPTLAGSTLLIGNNAGTLYAIDVRNGHVLWTYRAHAPIMSNPVLWHGLAIVGEGDAMGYVEEAERAVKVGMSSNALLAVDAKTGQLRWRLPLLGSGMPTPAIIGNVLVHHNGAGFLSGVDPDTGGVHYTVDLASAATMSAIMPVGDDRFITNGGVVGIGNFVTERRASDGSEIWSTRFPGGGWGFGDCPIAGEGHLAFCNYVAPTTGADTRYRIGVRAVQRAYAVDVNDGRMLWDRPLESGNVPARNLASVPLALNGAVYFGSPITPYFHALDAASGQTRWRAKVRGIVRGGPVYKDGTLYFGDLGGYLWALDARTGKVIGSMKTKMRFNVGSPLIAGDTLVVGCRNGKIIAVPLETIRAAHDA
jgi:outer membrane protein assembly factor BamB